MEIEYGPTRPFVHRVEEVIEKEYLHPNGCTSERKQSYASPKICDASMWPHASGDEGNVKCNSL
jgi:hypothetical protein